MLLRATPDLVRDRDRDRVRVRVRVRLRVRVRVRIRVRVRVRVRSATPDWERVGHDGLKAGRMLSCGRTCVGGGHGWGQG